MGKLTEEHKNEIIKHTKDCITAFFGHRTSLLTILFAVFTTLKLTGYIDWSWWWVTAPLWGGIALFLTIIILIILMLFLIFLLND